MTKRLCFKVQVYTASRCDYLLCVGKLKAENGGRRDGEHEMARRRHVTYGAGGNRH